VQSISDGGQEVKFKQLKNLFFAPFSLYAYGQLSAHVRGQVSQKMAAVDPYFTEQVTRGTASTGVIGRSEIFIRFLRFIKDKYIIF